MTDFAILLIHATGKTIWLLTFEWKFGFIGCKLYQFSSALAYYANSGVVVSIAIDRLKVVYTSHIQGAASLKRVRLLLSLAWFFAVITALPQLIVWTTLDMGGWTQCTTVWDVSEFLDGDTESANFIWKLLYETLHQLAVFWGPFLMLLISYLLIVVKVLRYTLRAANRPNNSSIVKKKRYKESLRLREKERGKVALIPVHTSRSHTLGMAPSLAFFNSPIRDNPSLPLNPTYAHRKSLRVTREHAKRRTSERPESRTRLHSISTQVWKSQLRSKVFITSLVIVLAHFVFWLPYNLLNTVRFFDAQLYDSIATDAWAVLLEDLIILNSLVNPLLYG